MNLWDHAARKEAFRPKPRGQCCAILARLRSGPATSWELAQITFKFTQRISDLRKMGYTVECESCGRGNGSVYTLEK